MIDLHSHVLPGIDDGPGDIEGSVELAGAAVAAGIRTSVATPHLREDHPAVVVAELAGRVDQLNALLAQRAIDLTVVPGAEVALTRALGMSDTELRAATLGGNGRDVLLETPYGALPDGYEPFVERLMSRGFRVLAAHPERNPTMQSDPRRLGRLVEAGMLVQLTAASLQGRRRSRARALAFTALEQGWVHALGSDAHSARWRPPELMPAIEAATRRLPALAAELRWMVEEAPRAILEGRTLPPRPARRETARRVRLRRAG